MDRTEQKIKRDPSLMVFDEKTPFWVVMRYKYLTTYFLLKVVWAIFRLVLLVGISYVIILPYISKISCSFMSREDFVDPMVKLIPKYPTLDTYKAIINENGYFKALGNTATLSLLCAFVQTMTCTIVGYGFAKFKFKYKNLLFLCVVFTMVIPHQSIQMAMFMKFRYFDIWGIYGGIAKLFNLTKASNPAIANLLDSYWPLGIMSFCGLAFKNGLYIFIRRQYYKGVPDELEEAAYVDGAGVFRTFVKIILPMSVPMMVTIFMFAFSWQWTDTFYTQLFFYDTNKISLMPNIVKIPRSLNSEGFAAHTAYVTAIRNTCGLMILTPLVIIYMFAQRTLIEGVERSGITG